jgi:phenylacetic acid degradation operon negative regulatory protein
MEAHVKLGGVPQEARDETEERGLPARRRVVTRPNSFIFTLYGDIVHRHEAEGQLWIGALIGLMAPFGLSGQAVRQAVSRMARQGWLVAARRGNRAYYAVTERGRRRIDELSPRIYGPVIEWDGGWRMVSYTVSEARRDRRDRLRKELRVLGWAPLSASTWISPGDTLEAAREAAAGAGALDDVALFRGRYCGPLSDRALVERCWNLAEIACAYGEFIARYQPLAAQLRAGTRLLDEDAFVARLWLVHDYRKITYVDPGLPSELVPAHWPRTTAAALFRELYSALDERSQRFFNRSLSR